MTWKININGTFFIILIFVTAGLLLSIMLFDKNVAYYDDLKAENAVLDLTDIRLEKTVKLEGEWGFYPNQFINGIRSGNGPMIVNVPHHWKGSLDLENENEFENYGTYELRIRGLNNNTGYGLYIYDLISAYKVYINGELIGSNGQASINEEQEHIFWNPQIKHFMSDGDDTIIHVQVSNHHFKLGGLWKPLRIGKIESITLERDQNVTSEMIMFGGIIMIGIYNLSLFLLNDQERSALYFALFCFAVSIRIPLMGERLINLWIPSLDWIVVTKFQYFLGYSMLGIFAMFLSRLFHEDFNKWVIRLIVGIVVLLNLTIVFLSTKIYYVFDQLYGYVALAFLIYVIYVLILAMKRKRQGSIFSFVGLTFVLCTTIAELILPHGNHIVPIGIFVFMLFQSLVIADKYYHIFSENIVLYHTASRDSMTGLFNKGHFLKLGKTFFKEASETERHGFLFIDIDDFKKVNDTYGHEAGDELIITISERIIRSLRNSDIACRYGGDEFVVWLRDAKEYEVKEIASRLLEIVTEPIQINDDELIITLSMGVSFFPKDGNDIEKLINKSDKLMYRAKSKGKNQYVMD